jgi:hypothetical protein
MNTYIFQGVVRPERAQLSLQFGLVFKHLTSGVEATAQVSIILNQTVVWVETQHVWDLFDLRNVVANIVQGHLQMIGFLKGYGYDLELTRVINREQSVDYVFGIEIPCVAQRNSDSEFDTAMNNLRKMSFGEHGIYFVRCLSDLSSAMKKAEDTGFYCYRAIESLRHHFAAISAIECRTKLFQWQRFREVANCSEEDLREIKAAADPVRHGQYLESTSADRARLFTLTWNVVEGYIVGALPFLKVEVLPGKES